MRSLLSIIAVTVLLIGCQKQTPDYRSTLAGAWSEQPVGYEGVRFTLTQDHDTLRGKGVFYKDTGPDYEHPLLVTGNSRRDMVTLTLLFDDSRQESRAYRRMLTRFDTVYLEPLNTNKFRILIRQDEVDILIKKGHNRLPVN